MANTVNDVMSRARQYYQTAVSPTDVTSGVALRLMSAAVTNDGSATTTIFHDSTAADNAVFTIRTTTVTQSFIADFGPQGVLFADGLSIHGSVGNHNCVITYILE